MELKRKAYNTIKEWYDTGSKALLVKGARQVGKTHLIRMVLKEQNADFFEVNLIETIDAVKILSDAQNVDELILGLSTITSHRFIKGKTILFFDEIQKYPDIVTKIKFLVDEGSYRYILSGSLLGIELNNIESAPVGYLKVLEMYPLDFSEFLQITNIDENVINSVRESFIHQKPVMDTINSKMLEMYRRYLIVGGMPEAVNAFAESSNVNDVIDIHNDITSMYKLDFTQYEEQNKRLIINKIYDQIPAELLKQNRRFIISDVEKGLRFDRTEDTFLWLYNAGVAIPVFNATEPKIPLKLNEKSSLFKLYYSDVGMLTSDYGIATKRQIITDDRTFNAGGIYENAVVQELYSKGFKPHYYNSKKLGELDIVIEYNNSILPIEIKSGKDYKVHSAITNCVNNSEFNIKEAVVFANCNVSKEGKILYLPIYMTMFIEEDNSQMILEDVIF